MKRALALLAVALAVACSDQSPLVVPARPDLAIQDATHGGGNPDFFFLPPLVPDPSSDPRFDAGAFNPNLSPVVEVCRWDPGCGAVVAQFTMTSGPGGETVRVSTTDQQYMVNWHTDLSSLDPALTYRIRVSAGGKELGLADVDVVSSGSQLKNVQTGQYIGLVDGRTLPIKFRIENGALCNPPGTSPCGSGTVNLTTGGSVVVPGPGDRIDIPPQTSGGPVVTLTIQYCDGIDVDVPRFGPCMRITSDPPDLSFSPRATVSVCSLPAVQLAEEQRDLVTMYRQHGEVLMALPHATDHCETTVGAAPAPPRNLAEAGWRLLQRTVTALFGSRQLYATAPMLHLGAGGQTPAESDFQFVLPAQMTAMEGADGQSAAPGDAVAVPPGVMVTDLNGAPVAGATVHFLVTDGGGTVTPLQVTSDVTGQARVTSWTLGQVGANQVTASGLGIAGPEDGGPFMPPMQLPPEEATPVTVATGEVFFNATATSPPPDLMVESLTHDPANPTTLDLTTFSAVVRNVGSGSAGQSHLEFRIGGETPGTPQVTFAVPALAPGEASTVVRQMTLNVAQGYQNTAIADINNEVAESNEANNQTIDNYVVTIAQGVTISSVDLASSTLTIGGPNVGYTITYSNGTSETLSGVVVQAYVDQGDASRAAGGVVVDCGPGDGVLPARTTCRQSFTVLASNADAGTGTLLPGSATARFQLLQGSTVLATFNVAVTLQSAGGE